MTKSELIARVADKYPMLYQSDIERIVNTIFDTVSESIISGSRVELRGFGSFRIRQRNARVGRNPKSGQKVDVPSKKVPFFKAGKELRELVDEKEAQEAQENQVS